MLTTGILYLASLSASFGAVVVYELLSIVAVVACHIAVLCDMFLLYSSFNVNMIIKYA